MFFYVFRAIVRAPHIAQPIRSSSQRNMSYFAACAKFGGFFLDTSDKVLSPPDFCHNRPFARRNPAMWL